MMNSIRTVLAYLIGAILAVGGLFVFAACQPTLQADEPPQPVWRDLSPDELKAMFTLQEPTSIDAVKAKSLLAARLYGVESPTIAEVRRVTLAEAQALDAPVYDVENNPNITIEVVPETLVWLVIVNGRYLSRAPGEDHVYHQYQIVWDSTRSVPPLGHAPYGSPSHILRADGTMVEFPTPVPQEWLEKQPTVTATPGGPPLRSFTPSVGMGSTPIPVDTPISIAAPSGR